MSQQEKLAQIIGLLLKAMGHEELLLSKEKEILITNNWFTWYIDGLSVSPYGELWIQTDGAWYPVREKQGLFEVDAIYEGVKNIPELKTVEVV